MSLKHTTKVPRFFCVLLALTLIVAARAEAQDKTIASSARIGELAQSIGMETEFEHLFATKPNTIERYLAEARVVRLLWQTEFELRRILTEIQEERLLLSSKIEHVNNRRVVAANTLDSVNFLSSSIVALVGNCIFIPAPPPRPKIPNILLTTANGVSTGLSLVSLMVLQDRKTEFVLGRESMLEPLFRKDFNPPHSGRVWTFLNYSDNNASPSLRNSLLKQWKYDDISEEKKNRFISDFGLEAPSVNANLARLRKRLQMLDDLEKSLLRLSRNLSELGHTL